MTKGIRRLAHAVIWFRGAHLSMIPENEMFSDCHIIGISALMKQTKDFACKNAKTLD
jgi:hypothetical protein